MIKKCILLAVLCEIVVYGLCQEQCVTPNKKPGQCIPLTSCGSLMEHLYKRQISDEIKTFLRASLCSFKESTPIVCCEQDANSTNGIQENKTMNLLPEPGVCGIFPEDRIIGGIISAIDAYPWDAILQYKTAAGELVLACGGILINQRYVLTAAHCVTGSIKSTVGQLVSVRLGEFNINTDMDCDVTYYGQDCADPIVTALVENTVFHPGYSENGRNREHDIALVRLAENIEYSDFIKPVCLPKSNSTEINDTYNLVLSGWGITPTGNTTIEKHRINVGTIPQETCKTNFEKQKFEITEEHICIRGVSSPDFSCDVDSGGALLKFDTNDHVFRCEGINSIRVECGNAEFPQVFTKVSKYIDWIVDNIRA